MDKEVRAEDMISRYSRQMILPQISTDGQRKLCNSKVLVVGSGGIGSTAIMYLAASGVDLHIVDFDDVELSNLHRQIIHREDRCGEPKVLSAIATCKAINSSIEVTGTNDRLSTSNAIELIINCNLVVDATDNYEARYIINDACVMLKKPFVTASAMGVEGQLTVIKPYVTACYRCLYPEASITESCRSCADAGVMGPVPGLIGCLEAIEAMKVVMCMEQSIIPQTELSRNKANMQMIPLTGKQILYDASSGEFLNLVLPQRDEECRVCGLNPTITSLDDTLNFLMNSRQSIDSIRSQRNGTDLPFEHISMKLYSVSVHRKSCHLVVDVRSNVQFAMLTLPGLLPLQISTLKDLSSIDLGSAKGFLVNLPLSILVGDLLQEKHGESLSSINLLDSFVRTITNKGGSKVEIYVTCRRGIDSRVATSLLTKHYSHQSNSIEIEVFNLDGGLVAWKNEVDPAFPMY